uniref:Uncharacterized protein n=1 Tax=Amphimedon queenslandica TaxID=400682 RepID=A0A1X7TZ47_AMPQE
MTAKEYISFDNDLDTCLTFEETGEWREELRGLACGAQFAKRVATEESDDDENADANEDEKHKQQLCTCSTIRGFDLVIEVFNDLVKFLSENGMVEVHVQNMLQVRSSLEAAKLTIKLIQTDLKQYFRPE